MGLASHANMDSVHNFFRRDGFFALNVFFGLIYLVRMISRRAIRSGNRVVLLY